MQFLVELGTSGWPGHPQPPAGSDELQDSGQAHPPLLILRIQGVKALVKVLIQGLGQGALHLCLGGLWEFQHAQEAGQHGALCRCGSSEMGRGGRGRGGGRQSADFDSPSQPRERCTGLHAGVRDQPPRPTWSTRV